VAAAATAKATQVGTVAGREEAAKIDLVNKWFLKEYSQFT
jgi:hypothetical protein